MNYLYITSGDFSLEKHKPMYTKGFGLTIEYFCKIQNNGNSLKTFLLLRFN